MLQQYENFIYCVVYRTLNACAFTLVDAQSVRPDRKFEDIVLKIDQEYLKTLLNTFIDSSRSFTWVADFIDKGVEIDDKFLFHIQILEDQNFVECLDKKSDIGYEITLGGEFEWKSRPLRLTAAGHEFVEAINRSEIWSVIKKEFKDSSLSTLKSAASSLLKAFAKKQINKYFEL